MNFTDYQVATAKTALYTEKIKSLFPTSNMADEHSNIVKLLALSYTTLGLGEVGELQNKVKKIIRDSGGVISDEKKVELSKELGDILWYVSQTCTELDLNMGDVARENIEKLSGRKERGTLCGSGDNR